MNHRLTLWFGFLLTSSLLGILGWVGESAPYGDVSFVYRYWAYTASTGGDVVGISSVWVYPLLALVPILTANVFGGENYAFSWIVLVTLVNACAFWVLLGKKNTAPSRRTAAWWWLLFMLMLGPIAVARLDSLVTPLAIMGLLLVFSRPAFAAVLLTIGTWIKVWPAAIVLSVIVTSRHRWRVLAAFGAVSVAVILVAAALGAGMNTFSFLGQQSSRSLQIESPWATPFLWLAYAHVAGYGVYYNPEILTFEVSGLGVEAAAWLSSLLLITMVAGILVIAVLKQRRQVNSLVVLSSLCLSLTAALILFNKVGSPQYIGWLAAPVVAGIIFAHNKFLVPAIVVLLLALFTQAFYPYNYQNILTLQPAALLSLTARNILELVTFVVAIRLLLTSKVVL